MLREVVEKIGLMNEDKSVHNEFKTYEQIEKAVKAGKPVFWANGNYEVQYWETSERLFVMSLHNANAIGLGKTEYDISRCYIDKDAAEKAVHNKNSHNYKS